MGELWHDLVDALRQRPTLWLPVLMADLFGYGLNLLRNAILHALVLHESAQRSVLGGTITHAALTPAAVHRTTVLALLLSWLTYFLRLLLYSGAFFVTAALVRAYIQQASRPAVEIKPVVTRQWSSILDIALRALSIYALAALLFSWLTSSLAHHGQTAIVHSPWFGYGCTLLVLLVLCLFLAPVALRLLSGVQPAQGQVRTSQQFAFSLVFIASVLALFVGANSRQLTQITSMARIPLELVGSLVVALPYAPLFVGMVLLARRITGYIVQS